MKMTKISYKKELKQIGGGLLYVALFMAYVIITKPTTWVLILSMMFSATIFALFKKEFSIKSLLKTYISIIVIIWGIKWLNYIGVAGWIITAIVIPTIIIINKRKAFFEAKHKIESMVWGKPLKEFIKENKKPPKIVLTK
jgi:hypothetical protein